MITTPTLSTVPVDVVPAGCAVILGMDFSSDGDCSVTGFYDRKTGEYHIQEAVFRPKSDVLNK